MPPSPRVVASGIWKSLTGIYKFPSIIIKTDGQYGTLNTSTRTSPPFVGHATCAADRCWSRETPRACPLRATLPTLESAQAVSSEANNSSRVIVACPGCGRHLSPPVGAPRFRCPCGRIMQLSGAAAASAAALHQQHLLQQQRPARGPLTAETAAAAETTRALPTVFDCTSTAPERPSV